MSTEIEPGPALGTRLAALEAENAALRDVMGQCVRLILDADATNDYARGSAAVRVLLCQALAGDASAYRARVLAEAAQACEGEQRDNPHGQSVAGWGIASHNRACEDCAAAVRRLGEQG